jgi:peptide deformylase
MVLPIYAYGHPVLRQSCKEIDANYPQFNDLLDNMWETMYHSKGMGLAAPQIGLNIRLFLVDSEQLDKEDLEGTQAIKQAFINPVIVEQAGDTWPYEEGCLSIPDIRGKVYRQAQLKIRYQDEQFQPQERIFSGITARIIQHEYDHINGILFTDHLSALKKRLIKKQLDMIQRGKVSCKYRMIFG